MNDDELYRAELREIAAMLLELHALLLERMIRRGVA